MKSKYQFVGAKENYEDYSSGRVIYGTAGAAKFPVRLSSEVFQQCAHYLKSNGKQRLRINYTILFAEWAILLPLSVFCMVLTLSRSLLPIRTVGCWSLRGKIFHS